MSPGLFVTFEGPEGAGKSTQIERLVGFLRDAGHDLEVTREPGGTPTAEAIREVVLGGRAQDMDDVCELLLMLAGRADHVGRRIRPALAAGKVVICDRFIDSTAAYQGGARGLDPAEIARLNRLVCGGTWPDLTVLLDLDPEQGLRRAATFGHDRIEKAGLAFHRQVRATYLALAEAEPARFLVVDASRDVEAVQADVRAGLTPHLARLTAAAAAG